MAFTLVFEGDPRDYPGNFFKTETPYGLPVTVSMGDCIDQMNRFEEALEWLRTADPEIVDAATEKFGLEEFNFALTTSIQKANTP